jgi:cell division protein FtsB
MSWFGEDESIEKEMVTRKIARCEKCINDLSKKIESLERKQKQLDDEMEDFRNPARKIFERQHGMRGV